MSPLPDYGYYQLEESEMITKRLNGLLYHITRGIPWLVQKWPQIQQYLLTGNLYLMGEARLKATLCREVTFEPEPSHTKQSQEQEQEEEYAYTLSVEEDLEAARVEVE